MIPKLIKIRQKFVCDEAIADIEERVRQEVLKAADEIQQGDRVAIGVGSRGIANHVRIVKSVVDTVKELGAKPFIVPAMGSHGGATAEGQKAYLAGSGFTEEQLGVPIHSSMEVVELPNDGLEHKVYMDKFAYEADKTIVVNRIKPHPDFHGPTESGLTKMLVIGLGKHKQALAIHHYGVDGLRNLIRPTAERVLKYGNIVLGIGIIENAYDETAVIAGLRPPEWIEKEIELLERARSNMPSLPADKIDLLIVDYMGKNLSGCGLDTNIIGRMKIPGVADGERPQITSLIISDLAEESHGNALGMGFAEFVTKKLADKVDFQVTYENVVTSSFLERGKLPIVAKNDRQAIAYAMRTYGAIAEEDAKIMRIHNTLHISELYVSKALLHELSGREDISIIGEWQDMVGADGELTDF